MAYRFKLDEPLQKGFRRIARDQIEQALAELSPDEITPPGVHASRKALKRLRATIRLVAPAIGAKAARQHNAALRDAGRLLARQRDQTVTLETLAKLDAASDAEVSRTLAPLRAALAAQPPGLEGQLDASTRQRVRDALANEAKRLAKTKLKGRGFVALESGLEQSYRAGRRTLKKAYALPTHDTFHDLRKAVQWHWRQMSLLSRAWPEAFAVRVAAARELSQILGDDHDLALLEQTALTTGTIPEAALEPIRDLCRQRQAALRDAAHARAARLFAEPSGAFVRRMADYWQAGRRVKVWPEPRTAPGEGTPLAIVAAVSTPGLRRKRPVMPVATARLIR